jgi:transcription antitermination factor NusG
MGQCIDNITSVTLRTVSLSANVVFSPNYGESHWYAAYTRANHEKRIGDHLDRRGVEFLLPLYETVRRWKDRRVRLHLPLFPGYIFVRMPLCDRLRVLQVPGVVRLLGFSSVPAPLPDEQMEALRKGLALNVRTTPHPYLNVGRRVRVVSGPLAGLRGILARYKNNFRVVLSLELIRRSVAVEVDMADIEPIFQNAKA